MAIDLSSSGLRERSFATKEELDPMSSLANLSDVMLVLACGLMLALVVSHGLQLSTSPEEVQIESQMTEVDDIDAMADDMTAGGSSYNELGMVYQDPTTGKMYMLSQDAPAAGETDAAAGGTTADAQTTGN